MKFVIAQMQHETNTFSPVPTPWEAFGKDGPLLGQAALDGMRGTRMAIGAFIDLAEAQSAQIVIPVAGYASPSGPVDPQAYDRFCELICTAVADGCDAIFLDLHGAMVVADRTDDGEGMLLEKIRAIAPKTPLAVSLDLHGNVTETMVRNCDVLTGYKTYPHVDMYESGELAGRILLRYLKDEIKPVMAWGNRPLLAQTLQMNTDESPMKDFVDAARDAERNGLLAATAFGGFQMADIADAGISVVTVANGDQRQANAACEVILDEAWQRRFDFIYRGEPLEQALAKAKAMAQSVGGPILLLDHADNCASGANQDTMYVLKEALRQGLSDIAVGPIRDPESVGRMIEAGVGATVTLKVGGKMDMPAIGRKGEPLELTGVVRAITDGEYTITGPQLTGVRAYMGRTAVLDTGTAQVVITERNQEPWDRGIFTSVGIDPRQKRFLLLKSRMYFRPVFLPIAKGMVLCDSIGVGSSDWTLFDYHKLRRPIYPLDNSISAAHR
ncbi:MAG: M81 family metallopeptidase [Betaproteobacteria bacterium]